MLSTSIRGGDLKTISPGDYITCQSSLYKTENFPHILGWRGRGSLLQPVYLHWMYTFLLVHFPMWIFTATSKKLKPVWKKHPHAPSSLFSLGIVQNCKKTEKYCTSVWEEINKKLMPPNPNFSNSVEATNSNFFTGESRCFFSFIFIPWKRVWPASCSTNLR